MKHTALTLLLLLPLTISCVTGKEDQAYNKQASKEWTIVYYMPVEFNFEQLLQPWRFSQHESRTRQKTHLYYQTLIKLRLASELSGNALAMPDDNDYYSLPCRLITENYIDLLELLLKNGMSPHYRPKKFSDEYFPLLTAAIEKNIEATKLLLAYRADANRRSKEMMETALHVLTDNLLPAQEKDQAAIAIAELLLQYNANPNIQNNYGSTPLSEVVLNKLDRGITQATALELARLLITSGTDTHLRTYYNLRPGSGHREKTALEIALKEGECELAGFIATITYMRDKLMRDIAAGNAGSYGSFGENLKNVRDSQGNSVLYHTLKHIRHTANKQFARKLIATWPHLLMQPNFQGESIGDFPKLRTRAELLVNSEELAIS